MARAFVLFGLLTPSGASAADSSAGPHERSARPASAVLAISASETPDIVGLRIRALGGQAIAQNAPRTGDPEVVSPSRLAEPAESRGAIHR